MSSDQREANSWPIDRNQSGKHGTEQWIDRINILEMFFAQIWQKIAKCPVKGILPG